MEQTFMAKIDKPDYRFRIVIIGDASVGKSALVTKFADDTFTSRVDPTIGIDFKTKIIDLEGFKVNVQLWDTAGQERFNSITRSYYKSGQAIMIAFDLSSRISFDNVTKWYSAVTLTNPNCPKILIGTKCDLVRQIKQEEIDELCKELKIDYIETSSKNNIGVDTAIVTLCSRLLVLYKDDKVIELPNINFEREKGYFDACYC